MGDKVLLLLLVLLFTIVKGQSTTTLPSNEDENSSNLPKSSPGDSQSSESTIRFLVMNPGDEKNEKPDNGITSTDENDDDESAELKMLESLLDGDLFGDTLNESNTKNGESDSIKHTTNGEPLIASNSDGIETKSHTPEFNRQSLSRSSLDESKEDREGGRSSSFEPDNNRFRNKPNSENTPLLQLTQGGYQRPFQTVDGFQDQRQSLRSESAPQQAETANSNENFGRAGVRQQSPYSSIFQQPFSFQPGPVYRHPFAQQPLNFASGRVPSDIQNSFYNTQPDISQGQYPQLTGAGEFPTVHFSLQTDQRNPYTNSEYLFQAPFQIPVSQSMPASIPEQTPQFFQQLGAPGYDNSMNSARSEFPALFGNPQANPQYRENPNMFNGIPNLRGNILANPALSFLPNYQNNEERTQLPPRFINRQHRVRVAARNNESPGQILNSTPAESEEKPTEMLTEIPNKEIPVSVPFGARIQRPNDGEEQNNFERQDNVYMRYPISEAGYATEETLPSKNDTNKDTKQNGIPVGNPFPFFTVPRDYNVYHSPDPYRAALETVQRGFPNVRLEDNEHQNATEGNRPEQLFQGTPNQARPEVPPQLFRPYPERNPSLSIPEAPFYPIQSVTSNRNPFEPIAIFPENHFQFANPPRPVETKDQTETPACAKANNDSICFEDSEYPGGDILYALNSDSFLIQRMAMPDQQLDKIPLIDQNSTEGSINEENYICKSEIKYGLPLRAQNTKGHWKVIVNMERAIGKRNFKQPIRLETCSGMGNPCTSVTEIKTACVQKFSLQHLLSWSIEKGVHNDVYRLPIACSCQILDTKA